MAFAEQSQQVLTVTILGQRLRQFLQLRVTNKTVAPGNLFHAGHFQSLTPLQRRNELAGFKQAVVGSGIEPGVTTLHDLHIELALVQIGLIDSRDFQFAAGAGLDGFGYVDHLRIVKVEVLPPPSDR